MRYTVTKKIAMGFSVVLLVGIVAMTIIYQGLTSVKAAMDTLARISEPASAAAFEMEIQVHGVVADVLGYSQTADPQAREEMRRHDAKFAEFRARYVALADTAEARDLGRAIGRQYDALKTMGEALIAKRDEQESLDAVIAANFDKIDRIIDDHIQPQIGRGLGVLYLVLVRQKVEAVLGVEADVAEVGLWLANYQRVRKSEYRDRIFQKERQVWAGIGRLKTLDLTPNERRWTGTLERLFGQTMSLVRQILRIDAQVAGGVKEFVTLANDVDRTLDDRIQTSAREGFLAPTRAAEQATLSVINGIKILLPLFVFSALGVGLLLVRVIVEPVKALTMGTEAVARGDLTYRVQPTGRDELADLSSQFNRMVAELEATTVSKRQLEASEQMLTQTVERLREEIADRVRAEQQQARLQASLRRAETMGVMGALVAGVAHEVRNPLFGISSVLDAMDARFGGRGEYERYLSTLRDQVVRLTALMNELFEYGRPPSVELAPGPVADVIEEAVRACGPIAETLGARIVTRVHDGTASVRMERTRLARVFENILRNAIQHSPPGGTVAVETRETREDDRAWIECAITDAGPGIPDEDLPRVFEPFFTRRRGGTGLGLSIVQRIVEEHGGRVTAGNALEGGAVVTVSLPVAAVMANRT